MPLTNAQLDQKIKELEKQMADGRRADLISSTEISETNYLNLLAKSYERNIRVVGLHYNVKDSQSLDNEAQQAWFREILKRALIDTEILKEEDVFEKGPDGRLMMRGIVSNIHPLSPRNNATIVIAFTESWFAQRIKDTVKRNAKTLKLKKGREELRIQVHLPPILEALHNEALKARRVMLDAAKDAKKPRRIHCNVKTEHPWIQLIEVVDGNKLPLPFQVEDGRLADPANSTAILALSKQKFTPFRYLSEKQKKKIPQNVMRAATPLTRNDEEEMDDE